MISYVITLIYDVQFGEEDYHIIIVKLCTRVHIIIIRRIFREQYHRFGRDDIHA